MKKVLLIGLLFSSVLLSGCMQGPAYYKAKQSDFVEVNELAADRLLSANLDKDRRYLEIAPPDVILVTSLVNIDQIQQSSRLGRMVSEQVGARLTSLGYNVTDVRLRQQGVLIQKEKGEIVLSRDVKDLASEHKARAILVGTYAEAIDEVYITLKLLEAATGRVMMAHNYALPLDKDNLALLRADRRRR